MSKLTGGSAVHGAGLMTSKCQNLITSKCLSRAKGGLFEWLVNVKAGVNLMMGKCLFRTKGGLFKWLVNVTAGIQLIYCKCQNWFNNKFDI